MEPLLLLLLLWLLPLLSVTKHQALLYGGQAAPLAEQEISTSCHDIAFSDYHAPIFDDHIWQPLQQNAITKQLAQL